MSLCPEHGNGQPLTVGELIFALLDFDPDSPVGLIDEVQDEGVEVSPLAGLLYNPDTALVLLVSLDKHDDLTTGYDCEEDH